MLTDKSEADILVWDGVGTRDDEIRTILTILQPFLAEVNQIPIIMGGDFILTWIGLKQRKIYIFMEELL